MPVASVRAYNLSGNTNQLFSVSGMPTACSSSIMDEACTVPSGIGALVVSPRAYATQKELMAGFQWLRRHSPVGLIDVEGFDPFWAVTTYADIVEVSRRHDFFHSGERASTLVPKAADALARSLTGGSPHLMRTLLQMDAPDHPRYRQITQRWFARQGVAMLENRVRTIARDLVDGMVERTAGCDFVREVAQIYPLRVMMTMLELPERDESRLLGLIQELFRSQDEAPGHGRASRDPARHAKRLQDAVMGFDRYFAPLLERARQSSRDDLIGLIADAVIDGRPIDRLEAISYLMVIVTAGHHTVASAISGAVWAMCEDPGEFRKVKSDPGLVPHLVEEAVRWTTPAQHVMRTATEDTVLNGRRIARGDWLMLCYLSGNRDELVFDAPDRFCVDRDRGRNLAFGYGAHICLGQHLARLEVQVFFEELLRRLAWIEISGVPRRLASIFVGGPRALPVKFAML
jgi:cytochrome P450